MKHVILTTIILIWSVLSFAQIDSNKVFDNNYKVNKFGMLVANVQPNMPAGFDAYGKSLNTKLDSAYFYSFSRTYKSYYSYDANGILVEKKSKALDTFRDYDSTTTEYIYNSYGLIEGVNNLIWNYYNNGDTANEKIVYEYNQDSLLIKKMVYGKNGFLEYDTLMVDEYNYDNNGRLSSSINKELIWGDSVFNVSIKSIYYYNNNSLLDSCYVYRVSNNGNLVLLRKLYYIYNSLSQLSLFTYEYVYFNSITKKQFFYDSTNMLIKELELRQSNVVVDSFIVNYKVDYIYDSNFNNTLKRGSYCLFDTAYGIEWLVDAVDSLLVNSNILVENTSYPFNMAPFHVFNSYEFDFFDINIPKKYIHYYLNGTTDTALVKYVDIDFFYSNLNVGINQINQEKIEVSISPNPFKERFIIKSKDLEKGEIINVYNIVGELIKSEAINSNEEVINLPDIASGVYFIRILDKDNTILATKKIIKL